MAGLGLIGTAIAGGMVGAGEVGKKALDYLATSTLQAEQAALMKARDERLSELRKGELATADELRRAPGVKAAQNIDKFNAPKMVEDGMGGGMMQAPTKAEQRDNARAELMRSGEPGLISTAMSMEGHDIQREEGAATRQNQRDISTASLASHERVAANALASHEKLARISSGIAAGHLQLAREQATITNALNNIKLGNEQDVQKLRADYAKATTPAERTRISENISILTGKDADKFVPVPLKDDMDNVTGYQIFDTKQGRFVDQGAKEPQPEDISGLQKRASNPQAVAYFESRYGKGSAAKYLGASGQAGPAAALFKDPLTGEMIDAAAWRKKYRESPKRAETEMRPY